MYNQGTQAVAGRQRSVRVRTYSTGTQWNRQRKGVHHPERVRLIQLSVCMVLFLTIFIWKGIFPQKLIQVRDEILTLISTDLDFEQALSNFGETLADSGTVLDNFGAFCIEIFGTHSTEETVQEADFTPPSPTGIVSAELQFLSEEATIAACTAHYTNFAQLGLKYVPTTEIPVPPLEEVPPAEETEQQQKPEAKPVAGTVIAFSDYSGDALPNNYTMDQVSLGELETMTPIMGHLNSVYGYREHPISGQHLFHGGVDIGGQFGDPIAAFATGTVEYTGENDSYGLYLQIDHGNGVKSFYAHCSKIEVTKGQMVSMGDTVARVGSTGSSTGPHLHLELKFNKMHLNPAYYVEFLEI